MNSLPFTIRGVYSHFVDLEGVAKIEGGELVIEYRTRVRHVLAKFIRSNPKELRLPLGDLEEAAFGRRLWLGFLHLRARSMSAFGTVPGNDGCELRLRCRRAHWPTAQDLASRINMRVVTEDLKALVDSNTPPRPLPPGPQAIGH